MLSKQDDPFGTGSSDPAYREMRRQLGYDDESEYIGEEEALWLEAPAESHVAAFRYIDGEDGPKIDIQFKPNGNSGVRQYRYTFSNAMRDAAKTVWEALTSAAHPGVDIWAYLIRGGIPYEETAVS